MTVDHQSYLRPTEPIFNSLTAVERRDALRNVVNRLRERQLSE
jgi:hypothetical protein